MPPARENEKPKYFDMSIKGAITPRMSATQMAIAKCRIESVPNANTNARRKAKLMTAGIAAIRGFPIAINAG
ncbi:hypothetical protein D9M68_991450 [compost metagenome]